MSIKGARAHQSLVGLHRWLNRPLEKLDFPIPYCSILFTDSKYITCLKTPKVQDAHME